MRIIECHKFVVFVILTCALEGQYGQTKSTTSTSSSNFATQCKQSSSAPRRESKACLIISSKRNGWAIDPCLSTSTRSAEMLESQIHQRNRLLQRSAASTSWSVKHITTQRSGRRMRQVKSSMTCLSSSRNLMLKITWLLGTARQVITRKSC